MLERQTQTWQNTGELFQGLIIARIKTALGTKIAQEGGKRADRTAGYSNHDDALRRELGFIWSPKNQNRRRAALPT